MSSFILGSRNVVENKCPSHGAYFLKERQEAVQQQMYYGLKMKKKNYIATKWTVVKSFNSIHFRIKIIVLS